MSICLFSLARTAAEIWSKSVLCVVIGLHALDLHICKDRQRVDLEDRSVPRTGPYGTAKSNPEFLGLRMGSGCGEHVATLVEQGRQRETEHKRKDRNNYLHRSDS